MTTYNGWTNFATWRVNLEMWDGIDPQEYCPLAVSDELGNRLNEPDLFLLADTIKESSEQHIEDTSSEGLARDYALAFLSDVNWREIAEHMVANYAEA